MRVLRAGGLSDLVTTIKQVHANLNRDPRSSASCGDVRPAHHAAEQVSEQRQGHFGDKVFDTVIPRNVAGWRRWSYGPAGRRPGVQSGRRGGCRLAHPGLNASMGPRRICRTEHRERGRFDRRRLAGGGAFVDAQVHVHRSTAVAAGAPARLSRRAISSACWSLARRRRRRDCCRWRWHHVEEAASVHREVGQRPGRGMKRSPS